MPRYYFNLVTGNEVVRDPEGDELTNTAAAEFVAFETARELVIERLKANRNPDGDEIEVVDGSGTLVGIVPLRKVFAND